MSKRSARSRAEVATDPSGLPSWLPRAPEDRPALERLDRAVYGFTAAERRLRTRNSKARELIPRGRLRALMVLAVDGKATPSQLAREAEVNPATITAMVDELEAEGVIRRRRDNHDGRVWWISLTAKGRREVAELKGEWDRRFAESFADIPDDHLEAASAVLERLITAFDQAARRDE